MPFNVDAANPADDAIVSQFPANERGSRTNISDWQDFEHSKVSGRHKIPAGTVAARNSVSEWEKGSMWINTDTTPNTLQIQVGNPPSMAWVDASGRLPGEIIEYAGATAPTGWLFCGGQAVSRTTFAALFAVIGTTYGAGDGSTTFNVPDQRGRVTVGKDNMNTTDAGRVTTGGSGINADVLGASGGSEMLQAHTHNGTTSTDGGHQHAVNVPGVAPVGYQGGPNEAKNVVSGQTAFDGTHNHAFTTQTTGGGSGQNMPPALVLNKLIKT